MPRGVNGKRDVMHLVERAYDSAFEDKPFDSFLPELAAALGADAANINVWIPELGGELAVTHQMPEKLVRIYREHHWRTDLWRLALERMKIPVGRAFAGHEIVPFRDLIKSEMYNDALRSYGLFDICGGRVFARGTSGAAISFMRARGRPFYSRREVGRLGAVLPHLARAFDIRLQLDAIALERDAFADCIDGVSAGAFLVGQDLRVIHATAKARALLEAPNGPLRLDRGRLTARDSAARRQLQALLARRDAVAAWSDGRAAILAGGSDGAAYGLKVTPASMGCGKSLFTGTEFLIVVETCERSRDAIARTALDFGLTAAEAALLRELVATGSLAVAAERLSRARNTVRNQLQAIFAKTGAHRQAELILQVLKRTRNPNA